MHTQTFLGLKDPNWIEVNSKFYTDVMWWGLTLIQGLPFILKKKKKHLFKDHVSEEATFFFSFEAFDCSTNVGRVLGSPKYSKSKHKWQYYQENTSTTNIIL